VPAASSTEQASLEPRPLLDGEKREPPPHAWIIGLIYDFVCDLRYGALQDPAGSDNDVAEASFIHVRVVGAPARNV